jgi:L-malate glycosyltransferase
MQLEKNKNGKKILIICPHPEGIVPGQRLKYEQYFESWRNAGYEITVESFMSAKMQNIVYKKGFLFTKIAETIKGYFKRVKLLFALKNYDIIYYFLWVTPFGPPIFERMFCYFSKKIIYDIDDLVYSKNKTTSWYIRILKGYSKPIFLMKKAHHIITCTPYLDNYVKQYNKNTTDISSTVDTENRYFAVNKYTNDKPIIIGWSGSHSTLKHFLTIQNVLKAIQLKYPTVIIKIMGGTNVEIDGVKIESCEWSETIEISTLQSFDIGIYPLPNEEWVYGKSSLKAIQYMALGIPTVATAIGTNFRVIEDGKSGFLVNNETEWIERISQLIENPDLRKEIGFAARKKIENEFSTKANAPKYLSILKDLC